MKAFYRLQDHCHLVKGASRGAIYDLKAGRVYSINRRATEILRKCQDKSIDSILSSRRPEDADVREFFDRLTTMGVGGVFFTPPPEKANSKIPTPTPPRLNFLWLELTSACNNYCVHCYSSSDQRSSMDAISRDRWLSLISEARQEGSTALQFIGGEPLLVPYWRELVSEAKKQRFDFIEVFSNGTLIDDDCISFFKEQGVHVATTIYGVDSKVHDSVTKKTGSFTQTMGALRKLSAANIPTRVASIITRLNEEEADKIMALCKDLGVQFRTPDVVRPTGRGDDKELMPLQYHKIPIKPPFCTDRESFFRALHFNSCFAGKIAITPTGDVIPCIFARSQICGNVLHAPLKDIIGGEALQKYWRTTKDSVEKCKDCEYRYACEDCRPLAQGHDPLKGWLSKSQGCSYDPYKGEWPVDAPSEIH